MLVLVAVVIVAVLAMKPVGPTAILFSFVGMPCLVAGLGLHLLKRWREGAFSNDHTQGKELP
jgi:hypothetical protein